MSGPYKGCYSCGWVMHWTRARDYKYCPRCRKKLGEHADTRDFDASQPGEAQRRKEKKRDG